MERCVVYETAARYYAGCLATDEAAIQWLSARGIARTTADRFGIGVARGGLVSRMWAEGIGPDQLLDAGLCRRDEDCQVREVLKNRLTIPIRAGGEIRGILGRALTAGETPIYIVVGAAGFLWNEDRIPEAGEVTLVEGVIDAVLLEQAGISAVAAGGIGSMNSVAARLGQARRVRVRFHPDAIGEKMAAELSSLLGSAVLLE